MRPTIGSATDPLPRPMEGEHRPMFCARFGANQGAKQAYSSLGQRHIAAEQAWATAKSHSLVSIKTSAIECLLFGRLDENDVTS